MITQRQFHFSWATGTALMAGGAALASTGNADWGLFWVGGLITGARPDGPTESRHGKSNGPRQQS